MLNAPHSDMLSHFTRFCECSINMLEKTVSLSLTHIQAVTGGQRLAEKARGSVVKLTESLCHADALTREHGTMTAYHTSTNMHPLTNKTTHTHTHSDSQKATNCRSISAQSC